MLADSSLFVLKRQIVTKDALPLPPEDTGFATRVRSAVVWRWGSQVLMQIITWTATLFVIRLLDPHDYGLFAMSQTVLVALNFLNGYSFATSLIQTKEVDDRRIGQVFGMLIVAAITLAITQIALAPLAADYYGQPLVADMLRVQAVLYLTTPFIALPSALLARKIEFKNQAMVNMACAIIGAITALSLAWLGYGVWALVLAPIAIFVTRAMGLTIVAKLLVRPIFDFRGAGEIAGFGTALTLCQLFWIIQSQSDIFIAGRNFTPHELGLYSEALFLTLIFTGRFLPPLNEVAFPAYAELHNGGRPIGPAFLRSARLVMLMAAPLYIGLSLTAKPMVATLFGPGWLEMSPLVAGLALAMPAMALQIGCSPATNALGRPRIYLLSNISGAIIMPACFLWGIQYGAMGLVHAWWIASPLLLAITLLLTLPVIGVRFIELVQALFPVAIACGFMALGLSWLNHYLTAFPEPLQLAILVPTGGLIYGAVLWIGWPKIVRETWQMLRQRGTPQPAPEAVPQPE